MAIEFHRDGPWELPEGWVWARLGDLCDFVGRGRGPSYVEEGGVPVVNQKCVRWRKFEKCFLRQTARDAFERLPQHLRLQTGDILWNSTGTGTIGRAVVYDGRLSEVTVDSHITIVRPRLIDSDFVCSYIETMRVQRLVIDEHVGSTNQQELPRAFVQELLIPVPPVAEQRRIVARIDELLTEIADGETALARARDDLGTWRRALLKAAVTGELTREWRENSKTCVSGSDRLDKILGRTKHLKQRGRRTGSAATFLADELPVIPSGWAWARLGDLLVHLTSGSRDWAPYYDRGEGIFVLAQNVRPGKFDHTKIQHVDPPKSTETERTRLRASDLLVTIVGANTGDVCRVDFAPKSHFVCQSVALLRLADLSLAEYLTYVLISEVAQMQFRQFTYGAGRPHLSFDQIENTHVPVPPEAEGQEICSRLKSTFLGLDDTAMLTEERSAGVHLRQSILKAAFEGRLLKQDPRDATANGLLAPLTEQSGSMPPARRPRRRRDAIAAE